MSHPESPLRLAETQCRLVIVQDQFQPCPYRDGVIARMPLRLAVGSVTQDVTDELLGWGYRRSGDFVYRTQCPTCQECQPTRVLVDRFQPTASMRRVLRRGDRELNCRWGEPAVDRTRLGLFNEHRRSRGLNSDGDRIDAEAYRSFLVDSNCESQELSVTLNGQLVAVSIVDIGRESTSAVYTHFAPEASKYSLGTYAILKQIERARQTSRKYVYLGMYVAENRHLNYKARFLPQERLTGDDWVEFA